MLLGRDVANATWDFMVNFTKKMTLRIALLLLNRIRCLLKRSWHPCRNHRKWRFCLMKTSLLKTSASLRGLPCGPAWVHPGSRCLHAVRAPRQGKHQFPPVCLSLCSSPLKRFAVHFAISIYPNVGGLTLPRVGCWGRGQARGRAAAPRCTPARRQAVPVAETMLPLPPVFKNGFSISHYLT